MPIVSTRRVLVRLPACPPPVERGAAGWLAGWWLALAFKLLASCFLQLGSLHSLATARICLQAGTAAQDRRLRRPKHCKRSLPWSFLSVYYCPSQSLAARAVDCSAAASAVLALRVGVIYRKNACEWCSAARIYHTAVIHSSRSFLVVFHLSRPDN